MAGTRRGRRPYRRGGRCHGGEGSGDLPARKCPEIRGGWPACNSDTSTFRDRRRKLRADREFVALGCCRRRAGRERARACAHLAGIERWFGGNRVVVRRPERGSHWPGSDGGAKRTGRSGFASLTLDVMGRSSWQVRRGTSGGSRGRCFGECARADAASIERLTMSRVRRINHRTSSTFDFGWTDIRWREPGCEASSAMAGRARFQDALRMSSVDATGLRIGRPRVERGESGRSGAARRR